MSLTLTKCSEVADGVARQSEGSPNFRFYVLYDKVYREDVMHSPMTVAKRIAEQQA